jgi:heterodisulfide reductase subunit A
VKVCPIEIPDSFNAGLSKRKAIFLPVPHAIPNTYIIDTNACSRCGECEAICPAGAIKLLEVRKDFRILVVDDELIMRDSLRAWLEDEGFSVDMAASGPEALNHLSKKAYELMLVDIKMPGMDGVELLQKAKEVFPDLSVVMMTAYATVETAVDAMKIGALDYLLKPFDPDTLIPMIIRTYQDLEAKKEPPLEVGALVLCGGTSYFDPAEGNNPHGYGIYPNVVTSLEFERILSGTGPNQGHLVRLSDGKPLRKVAWLQCVGSRDIQINADYCSSVCCMHAIKEALVAKERAGGTLEAAIFYMDMRTFGKSFQRYRDQAETEHGIRFEKGRIHSVLYDESSGDLIVRYVDYSGSHLEEIFDMVVLSVGQRPALGTADLAEMVEMPLNPWGFAQTEPFSLVRTNREGVVLGGAFSGLKDISESVIQASAAALSASRVIHAAGGSIAPEITPEAPLLDKSQEPPNIMIAVCTCGDLLSKLVDTQQIVRNLKVDPAVDQVTFLEQICTVTGWENLIELVEKHKPNRILIGSCLPCVYARKIKELGRRVGLNSVLIEVVDLMLMAQTSNLKSDTLSADEISKINSELLAILGTGLARLKWADPDPVSSEKIHQQALVVGGGIAGMSSALAIADHGFQVDLIEQEEMLGGNLDWLRRTLEGDTTKTILDETLLKVEKHPLIRVHTNSRVRASHGQVGCFYTTIEDKEKGIFTLEHGVTILATGGKEADTTSYNYDISEAIVTQKELEKKIHDNTIDPRRLESMVMIQCVDSREEPRNYCSRICCATALKHALNFKEINPEINVYIFYRDMMTYGFTESYYTMARKSGVIFIRYDVNEKPRVTPMDGYVRVTSVEPIIGQKIRIDADLVVLATGIIPKLPKDLAESFGATVNRDGFFEEAESKWRPVDSLKEGIFACGLAHSPRNITESIATAEAAAQRALRILSHERMPAGKVTAEVRYSLCSLCERCIEACPYGARMIDPELEKVLVNAAMCQGCGSCATVCPNSASTLAGFLDQQMFDVIDSVIEGTAFN